MIGFDRLSASAEPGRATTCSHERQNAASLGDPGDRRASPAAVDRSAAPTRASSRRRAGGDEHLVGPARRAAFPRRASWRCSGSRASAGTSAARAAVASPAVAVPREPGRRATRAAAAPRGRPAGIALRLAGADTAERVGRKSGRAPAGTVTWASAEPIAAAASRSGEYSVRATTSTIVAAATGTPTSTATSSDRPRLRRMPRRAIGSAPAAIRSAGRQPLIAAAPRRASRARVVDHRAVAQEHDAVGPRGVACLVRDQHAGGAGVAAGAQQAQDRPRRSGCRARRSARRPAPAGAAPTSARAIAIRWRWPPDSSSGKRSATSSSPTSSSASSASRRASRGRTPSSSRGSATFSAAVSAGIRLKSWKT